MIFVWILNFFFEVFLILFGSLMLSYCNYSNGMMWFLWINGDYRYELCDFEYCCLMYLVLWSLWFFYSFLGVWWYYVDLMEIVRIWFFEDGE